MTFWAREQDVVVGAGVERRVEVDKVDRFVLDAFTEYIEIVAKEKLVQCVSLPSLCDIRLFYIGYCISTVDRQKRPVVTPAPVLTRQVYVAKKQTVT